MMKRTGIKLELLTNYDMLMLMENGIRGGITQCSTRYAKATNRYLREEGEPPNKRQRVDKDENYILYIDANNL
jgi:hypothetical protein